MMVWGCSGTQIYTNNFLEGAIPDTWSTTLPETEGLTVAWCSAFEDERMTEALSLFRQVSPDIQSVVQKFESARQLAVINGAGVFPSLAAGGSGTRRKQNLAAFGFSDGIFSS